MSTVIRSLNAIHHNGVTSWLCLHWLVVSLDGRQLSRRLSAKLLYWRDQKLPCVISTRRPEKLAKSAVLQAFITYLPYESDILLYTYMNVSSVLGFGHCITFRKSHHFIFKAEFVNRNRVLASKVLRYTWKQICVKISPMQRRRKTMCMKDCMLQYANQNLHATTATGMVCDAEILSDQNS